MSRPPLCLNAGRVRLLSRNGKDFTKPFASIARALEALPDDTVIDGEIVAPRIGPAMVQRTPQLQLQRLDRSGGVERASPSPAVHKGTAAVGEWA